MLLINSITCGGDNMIKMTIGELQRVLREDDRAMERTYARCGIYPVKYEKKPVLDADK